MDVCLVGFGPRFFLFFILWGFFHWEFSTRLSFTFETFILWVYFFGDFVLSDYILGDWIQVFFNIMRLYPCGLCSGGFVQEDYVLDYIFNFGCSGNLSYGIIFKGI